MATTPSSSTTAYWTVNLMVSDQALFFQRHFAALFWTQFFGAFNDNFYKTILIIFIAFNYSGSAESDGRILVNLAALLLILPFLLFSALAGQLADKVEKARLIRGLKLIEMGLMLLASALFYFNAIYGLLVLLFFMGIQSTFFGPPKYSILPQLIPPKDLVQANAWVASGTFLAILLGAVIGGIISTSSEPLNWAAICVFSFSACGWLCSLWIPTVKSTVRELQLTFNPMSEIRKNLSQLRGTPTLFIALFGISWFWFIGAALLTQLPHFAKNILSGDESVVTVLLVCFITGISAGAFLCSKLSKDQVKLSLILIGGIGVSIAFLDLIWINSNTNPITWLQFFEQLSACRAAADFLLIGVFGGLYVVPLFTVLQIRTDDKHRSRIIATSNSINALSMIGSAVFAIIILGILSLSIPQFFLIIGCMNVTLLVGILIIENEFRQSFFRLFSKR